MAPDVLAAIALFIQWEIVHSDLLDCLLGMLVGSSAVYIIPVRHNPLTSFMRSFHLTLQI